MFLVDVQLTGRTPLLQHKGDIIETGKASQAGQDYSEEWKRTVYTSMEDSKTIVCPSMNLEAMLLNAAKNRKVGRLILRPLIASFCRVQEFEVDIMVNGQKVTIDDIEAHNWVLVCSAVVQRNRIMRARAQMPIGWQINFTLEIDNGPITKDLLHEMLETAGRREGLMDWRPGGKKPGKFGQFDVTRFDVKIPR